MIKIGEIDIDPKLGTLRLLISIHRPDVKVSPYRNRVSRINRLTSHTSEVEEVENLYPCNFSG